MTFAAGDVWWVLKPDTRFWKVRLYSSLMYVCERESAGET